MAKNGVLPCRNDMWGEGGAAQFDSLELPDAFDHRLAVLRDLVHYYDEEIERLDRTIHAPVPRRCRLQRHPGHLRGAPLLPAVFVAEIGDVHRFDSPQALCSWAGLAPSTGSPTARSTEAGSPNRDPVWCGGRPSRQWPAITVVSPFTDSFHAIAERRGKTRANIAIARKILTLVYYGLRDGEIRCLSRALAA